MMNPSGPKHNPKETTNGFTLLELSIVILLIGIIGLLATPAVLSAVRMERRTLDAEHALSQQFSISALLEHAFYDDLKLGAVSNVIVQPAGTIRAADGAMLSLSTSPLLKPDPDSTPLTVLHLNPSEYFEVVSASRAGSTLTLTMCDATDLSKRPATHEGHSAAFLLLSIDGYTTLTGSYRSRVLKTGLCSPFRTVSGTFTIDPHPLHFANRVLYDGAPALVATDIADHGSLVIGIHENFSIYLDRQHLLRRINHLASDNQPIARDIARFSVERIAQSLVITVTSTQSELLPARSMEFHYPLMNSAQFELIDLLE